MRGDTNDVTASSSTSTPPSLHPSPTTSHMTPTTSPKKHVAQGKKDIRKLYELYKQEQAQSQNPSSSVDADSTRTSSRYCPPTSPISPANHSGFEPSTDDLECFSDPSSPSAKHLDDDVCLEFLQLLDSEEQRPNIPSAPTQPQLDASRDDLPPLQQVVNSDNDDVDDDDDNNDDNLHGEDDDAVHDDKDDEDGEVDVREEPAEECDQERRIICLKGKKREEKLRTKTLFCKFYPYPGQKSTACRFFTESREDLDMHHCTAHNATLTSEYLKIDLFKPYPTDCEICPTKVLFKTPMDRFLHAADKHVYYYSKICIVCMRVYGNLNDNKNNNHQKTKHQSTDDWFKIAHEPWVKFFTAILKKPHKFSVKKYLSRLSSQTDLVLLKNILQSDEQGTYDPTYTQRTTFTKLLDIPSDLAKWIGMKEEVLTDEDEDEEEEEGEGQGAASSRSASVAVEPMPSLPSKGKMSDPAKVKKGKKRTYSETGPSVQSYTPAAALPPVPKLLKISPPELIANPAASQRGGGGGAMPRDYRGGAEFN